MKMSKDKMNWMLLIGGCMVSMAAGMVAGCMKEKMKKMDSCCIIDEL